MKKMKYRGIEKYVSEKHLRLLNISQAECNIKNSCSKICVHKYLTQCKTNCCPPGLADFLRGTIALYINAKQYGYEIYLEDSHPIYRYLLSSRYIIGGNNFEVEELLPPLSYEIISQKLNLMFRREKSFCIMTNSFYKNKYYQLENFAPISQDCKIFLQEILRPNDQLKQGIASVFSSLNILEPYSVIHLRFGDQFLVNNIYDENIMNNVNIRIQNLLKNQNNTKFILLSDSSEISKRLKVMNPSLYYWENQKIHIGALSTNTGINNDVFDTLIDFFILAKSQTIYYTNFSGFSKIISLIYDKPYIHF